MLVQREAGLIVLPSSGKLEHALALPFRVFHPRMEKRGAQ
jgi:hypothetical protein